MNRLGIQSLNAGAPDLRLTGEHNRGSYVQRRRAQMAGGGIMGSNAGSMLVAPTADGSRPGYGWLDDALDWGKEKIVDPIAKLIPNELKSPAALATIGGLGLNQFGLPIGIGGLEKGTGQNWIGDLLGNVMPGDTQFNTVLGDTLPFRYQDITSSQYPIGGLDQIAREALAKDLSGIGGGFGIGSLDQIAKQNLTKSLSDLGGNIALQKVGIPQAGPSTLERLMQGNDPVSYLKNQAAEALKQKTGLTTPKTPEEKQLEQKRELQRINWEIPLAVGAGAHEYQKKYLEDQPKFPGDETSIRFQTGAEAMADPTLRFKPQAQYANVAQGGRIGYAKGSKKGYADYVQAMNALGETPMPIGIYNSLQGIGLSDQELVNMGSPGKAQGGRVAAQEGGLMNLGGMEKDYRQEGGFVPIGGQEKADDVPARLSKNEFVFTADAVRSAGGGDIDAGAEVMENMMNHLEAGGEVSEDSQGLEGARGMFANAQQLEKRII